MQQQAELALPSIMDHGQDVLHNWPTTPVLQHMMVQQALGRGICMSSSKPSQEPMALAMQKQMEAMQYFATLRSKTEQWPLHTQMWT